MLWRMWILNIWLLFCLVIKIESCIIKEFLTPVKGKVLAGHVIQTLSVSEEETCKIHCYLNDICQSINVSPHGTNGMWKCELSDTDEKQNPQSFIEEDNVKYYPTKNPCSSSPCVKNSTCRPNFDDDDNFLCICPPGFTGKECNTAVTQSKAGYDSENAASSCLDVLLNTPESKSDSYYLKTEGGGVAITYCHMDDIPECGGGGWTLVMKIDGNKSTFSYHSNYWDSKTVFSEISGATGFDLEETKMPSYWSNTFTNICLGMKVGEVTKWLSIDQEATSLHSLIANNNYKATRLGRDKWKSLISGSSLQLGCNMEGFNVVSSTGSKDPAITRIGIISNNGEGCGSCNSRIGFGSAGTRGGQAVVNSCGNEAGTLEPDNGEKHIKANCYILIK